ncbi:MAG TPA: hypothetical protein VHM29_00400, partial [Acidimicrobiia bacterium]|nr:hypothetical protein [Acidimicrobiia bacterium]
HEDYGYGWYVAPKSEEVFYFRADGNGGQRILVVPGFDLVMVTTGADLAADALLEAVFNAATDGGDTLALNPTGVAGLEAFIDELTTGPEAQPPPEPPAVAAEVSGETYMFADTEVGLHNLRLDFNEPSEARLTLAIASEASVRVDRIGLDGLFRPSVEGRPIIARGMWEGLQTFVIEMDEGPGLHRYTHQLEFVDQHVTVESVGTTFTGSAEP